MSEFEKELDRIIYNGVTTDDEKFYSFHNLVRYFKDWQPPKKLVEVPKFIADWFEENEYDLDYRIFKYIRDYDKHKHNVFYKWFNKDDRAIETLISMKLYGYTVEKEKLFYLRNKITRAYLFKDAHDEYFEYFNVKRKEMDRRRKAKFTQSEIDDMETGSYEQIAVKVDEVEG